MLGWLLVPMAVPTNWRKCLFVNERLLFSRMVSSSIPIVWRLGAPRGRVLVCINIFRMKRAFKVK